jgi:cysteine desulfurase/selenocysteine lyase
MISTIMNATPTMLDHQNTNKRLQDPIWAEVRAQFPILDQQVNGRQLVYLDNAATTQKPKRVIDAISTYYQEYNANIHRGLHSLAERATAAYEDTREAVRAFINAKEAAEVIFTRGTTEGINLVAQAWGRANLNPGDEVLISGMEHHSNIVPWQMICQERGAKLKVIAVTDLGELDMASFYDQITEWTKMVAVVHVSNALGTINPVAEIVQAAKKVGAYTLVDGAQSTAHLEIDVQALDVDFFAFSSHKLYGPTGIGVLYGKRTVLDAMPPYQGGGEMIKEVSFEGTTYNELPYKFEAGTPNIADTVALLEAINFVNELGKPAMHAYEQSLLTYGTEQLNTIDGLRIIGQAANKISVLSFAIDGIHPQDLGILLDTYGIAVRTGHHCTQPLMKRLGLPGTTRASLAIYNTTSEVDLLVTGLRKAVKMLR